MNVKIADSWHPLLNDEFNKPYFKDLIDFVRNEYGGETCFPKEDAVFAAFNQCSFTNLKVVIIGQDPYHGIGQANGLCFAVNDGVKHPR